MYNPTSLKAENKVIAEDEEGNELACNISFIKRVVKPENEYKSNLKYPFISKKNIDRKLYPTRNCKPIKF